MSVFVFGKCLESACGLRFPKALVTGSAMICPACDGPARTVATAERSSRPDSMLAGGTRLFGLLDNVRSIHNVGSMFRSAESSGAEELFLCGITATPRQPRLSKAALGSELRVDWTWHSDAAELAQQLAMSGHRLWALERRQGAEGLFDTQVGVALAASRDPVVLVVGHERAGVDPGVIQHCERCIEIPMRGVKRSLNVAVAFGIAMYRLRTAETTA